jgi:hypothetical protein
MELERDVVVSPTGEVPQRRWAVRSTILTAFNQTTRRNERCGEARDIKGYLPSWLAQECSPNPE